ncbi:hypothetical protein FGG08_003320 [Glutinoglossum americanum]|uniref:tRNA (adenine(58)-N(1))-methyltransferase catalytic subunit TRM61 n=1 Tax=Glutinoglossum americanum TaxID=1670608 RepID=A0A9P8I7K4_9PEZI|nr:hypothetical protein FGG08_003320 [Glutinoglossum americanum]
MTTAQRRNSPFLDPGPVSTTDSLAILHLKRDLLMPTVLSELDEKCEGYDEGRVTNTRFGSFPHSTLIGLPWGSQVRASNVDTGSRGRRGPQQNKKRKRTDELAEDVAAAIEDNSGALAHKAPVVASTGFIHLLPPTPETWTASLPHRTQLVYTPDYSYILHRLRVRPGSVIIEAGAGSGSFSHASARAVFNGYPEPACEFGEIPPAKKKKAGKVWSYEFHEQRVGRLKEEIRKHSLEDVVEIVNSDVCEHGFLLEGKSPGQTRVSPQADAIFLDLPAPWLALRHLTRNAMPAALLNAAIASSKSQTPAPAPRNADEIHDESNLEANAIPAASFISPLNPNSSIRICTFSPCIEQVQRTVSTLRQLGWLEIEMVEIAHKRIEVRRERVGLHEEGVRGINASPATVNEAVERLKEVEGRFRLSRSAIVKQTTPSKPSPSDADPVKTEESDAITPQTADSANGTSTRKPFKEGRLIHRPEPELKTHTSYLLFALLPQEWTLEEEALARSKWPIKPRTTVSSKGDDDNVSPSPPKSKKQMKKAARLARLESLSSEAVTAASSPPREQSGGVVGAAAAATVEEVARQEPE